MQIFVNSNPKEVPDTINSLSRLLEYLNVPLQGTGVALNNKLVISRNWGITTLKPDDHVMIISASYGG